MLTCVHISIVVSVQHLVTLDLFGTDTCIMKTCKNISDMCPLFWEFAVPTCWHWKNEDWRLWTGSMIMKQVWWNLLLNDYKVRSKVWNQDVVKWGTTTPCTRTRTTVLKCSSQGQRIAVTVFGILPANRKSKLQPKLPSAVHRAKSLIRVSNTIFLWVFTWKVVSIYFKW